MNRGSNVANRYDPWMYRGSNVANRFDTWMSYVESTSDVFDSIVDVDARCHITCPRRIHVDSTLLPDGEKNSVALSTFL